MLMCAYVYTNVIFNAYYWESLEKKLLFKEATGTLSKEEKGRGDKVKPHFPLSVIRNNEVIPDLK